MRWRMTTKHPVLTRCPDWSDDDAERETPIFKAAVKKAYRNLEAGAAKFVIGNDDLRQWHTTLFTDIVPLYYYAGNYRQDSFAKPCLAGGVNVGSLKGISALQVPAAMDQLMTRVRALVVDFELRWEEKTQRERAVFISNFIGWFVANFVRIHPFVNGNGRTSRLIWTWGILRYGLPAQCRIRLRPDPPYESLMKAAMKGDHAPLTLHILELIAGTPPARP